jgi:DNA-binding response OmpR family regulator
MGLNLELASPEHKVHRPPERDVSEKGAILIIDDDPDILKILTRSLKDTGYGVVAFDNALEGLAKVKDIMPSLIILDVMMPGMDGMQLKKMLG